MGAYVDRILKGARPAELAVEVVAQYELIVNRNTAEAIGVAIPPKVIERADRIVQ